MITPTFSCTQDDDCVIVSLYVPSIRATEVSILVENCTLTVNVNPYFLRITFPSAVVEDDASSATYDPSSGYLTVKLSKAVKGEDFKDLDLLGKLMAASSSSGPKGPAVEVLDNEDDDARRAWLMKEREAILEAEAHDWHLPPSLPEPSELSTSRTHPYGFLNLHSGYFTRVTDTDNETNILGGDAETLTAIERWQRLAEHEEQKWDPEHYMADFVEDDMVREVLASESPYKDLRESVVFTAEDNATLLKLPRREYLLTPPLTRELYLILVNLLFSTAYDTLTTFSDPTSQSPWTISVLTPCFVALNAPPLSSTLRSIIIASYRRALAYPLYRHWSLCERLRDGVVSVLLSGRRGVVKVLLRTRDILGSGGPYAAYARIWVDDYISWTQVHASDDTLKSLGQEIKILQLAKSDVGWPLAELEAAAMEVQEGDSDDEPGLEDASHLHPAPL